MPIRVGAPQVQGKPLQWYVDKLDATRERTLQVLKGFTDEDLDRLVGEADEPGIEMHSLLYSIDLDNLAHHRARGHARRPGRVVEAIGA